MKNDYLNIENASTSDHIGILHYFEDYINASEFNNVHEMNNNCNCTAPCHCVTGCDCTIM